MNRPHRPPHRPAIAHAAVTLLWSAAIVLTSATAHACPKVGRLIDFNCDGAARIVVLGDSLVAGFGDTVHDNQGGYVLRAQGRLPEAVISNFGVPGLATRQLLLSIESAFDGSGDPLLAEALVKADVVILDLGRNDRWLMGPPAETFRNLKRISALVRKRVLATVETAPLVVTAVLMLPNRGSQGPWVKELNALIAKIHTNEAPADLHFDLVSKRLLSTDQIHPTPKGYTALATTFVRYILQRLPTYQRALRPDLDQDGLYDIFERSRFGTDPTKTDTDGDGVADGAQHAVGHNAMQPGNP